MRSPAACSAEVDDAAAYAVQVLNEQSNSLYPMTLKKARPLPSSAPSLLCRTALHCTALYRLTACPPALALPLHAACRLPPQALRPSS